jgi:hypothetical protein
MAQPIGFIDEIRKDEIKLNKIKQLIVRVKIIDF